MKVCERIGGSNPIGVVGNHEKSDERDQLIRKVICFTDSEFKLFTSRAISESSQQSHLKQKPANHS